MSVHQCPRCELRFAAKWELQAHLDADHPGAVKPKDRTGITVEDTDPEHPEPL